MGASLSTGRKNGRNTFRVRVTGSFRVQHALEGVERASRLEDGVSVIWTTRVMDTAKPKVKDRARARVWVRVRGGPENCSAGISCNFLIGTTLDLRLGSS